MARTAIGRLKEADEMDKLANKYRTKDPDASAALSRAAAAKRKSAVKQLTRRPKPRGNTVVTRR